MMTVTDKDLYRRYRCDTSRYLVYDLWLPMLLFGGMGAITWAIRGTDGWGGIDGVLVPGLTWGLFWYYLCRQKGIDARGVALWLGLGLALGGELGYGQYVSWIQGKFYVGEDMFPVSPWVGYGWFMICGIGWGAPGGIVLGWALGTAASARQWIARSLLMVALLAITFNLPLPLLGEGVVSSLGALLARYCPGLLFPNAELGLYAGELDRHSARTVYTNTQNFAALLWWGAAMIVAARQNDKTTLLCGAVIGGGFGFGFAMSAAWCHGYSHAPAWIDWWKMWELHAGFNLGALYALILFWATRRVDASHISSGNATAPAAVEPAPIPESWKTLFLAFSGFALVFAAGVEYFFWTGLFLALFYVVSMSVILFFKPEYAVELRKRICLAYSAFLLVFMLLHGVTSRLGVVLELYAPTAVDQYAWPVQRIILFAPAATVVFFVALKTMVRHYSAPADNITPSSRLPERMIDLCAFIGLVGAATIWPDKVGVVYMLFLCIALFALSRINARFQRWETARVRGLVDQEP